MNTDNYWTTVAQITPALALALIVEIRHLRRSWMWRRVGIYFQSILQLCALLLLSGEVHVECSALRILHGQHETRLDYSVSQSVVTFSLAFLLAAPVATVAIGVIAPLGRIFMRMTVEFRVLHHVAGILSNSRQIRRQHRWLRRNRMRTLQMRKRLESLKAAASELSPEARIEYERIEGKLLVHAEGIQEIQQDIAQEAAETRQLWVTLRDYRQLAIRKMRLEFELTMLRLLANSTLGDSGGSGSERPEASVERQEDPLSADVRS